MRDASWAGDLLGTACWSAEADGSMGGRAGSGKVLSLLMTPGMVGPSLFTLSRQFLCWAYQAGARTVTVVGRTFITLCREMVSSNTSRLEIRESWWREDRWRRKFLNI